MAGFNTLSPWDAFAWFDTPIETNFSLSGAAVLVAPAEPRRVALIFSMPSSTGFVTISTSSKVTASSGIGLTTQSPTLQLFQSAAGNLVQGAWYAFGMLGLSVTVVEVRLRDWPNMYGPGE
jgi:hypothetical protein